MQQQSQELARKLAQWRRRIDAALRASLPSAATPPPVLHRAMRHSLLAGGKRLRPILVLAGAEAAGADPFAALPVACAVECVHTYSLVHDDLPCMDDDDLRRGKPTCHKVFGEAVAVLAGDALLTLGFELAASQPATSRHPTADFVRELALAAGSRRLIAGQVADMESEGKQFSRSQLRFIHRGKTAAMIAVSLRLGAMAGDAGPALISSLGNFGERLGLAFQVVDDILDQTQSCAALGKSPGKDLGAGKATYPALLGLAGARREASRLTRLALHGLRQNVTRHSTLEGLAATLLGRNS